MDFKTKMSNFDDTLCIFDYIYDDYIEENNFVKKNCDIFL